MSSGRVEADGAMRNTAEARRVSTCTALDSTRPVLIFYAALPLPACLTRKSQHSEKKGSSQDFFQVDKNNLGLAFSSSIGWQKCTDNGGIDFFAARVKMLPD